MLVTGDHLRREMHSFNLSDDAKFIGDIVDGRLKCLAAFEDYNGTSIEVKAAANGMTRRWLRAVFEFAFDQCGCRRVTALCDASDFTMEPYMERLGFQYEGTVRHGLPDSDILIYGMIREECKWVRNQPRK